MKKILCVAVALVAMVSMVWAAGGKDSGAKSDGLGNTLVLYSTMTEFDLEALLACFGEKYPNINVEVVSGTIGETTSRIAAEAGNPQGDCTWGGLADSDGMQYADLFETWVSEYTKEAMDGYSTPNGIYSMDHLSTVCFCVNTDLEKELGISIKSYQDLLNPKLKGKVILSDPNSSSAAWNNLCNIMSVYGFDSKDSWDYIEKLMANLVISSSSSACFNSVKDGEYVVGLTYEDGAVKLLQNGAKNIRIQYPAEGTSASAFGVAIIKGAKHRAAAEAMCDFICSAEGQSAMAKYMQGTLRFTNRNYETPKDAWLTPASQMKWASRPVEKLTAAKKDILAHWNQVYTKVQK